MHLATIHKLVQIHDPKSVVMDPISNLSQVGGRADATAMLTRLIDFLKVKGITAVLTCLTDSQAGLERTDADVSSLVDTWLLLRDIELGGERNRAMYVLKARGMPHSNQLREFLLTDHGIELTDVYLGPEGVLTGSARQAQEARERDAETKRRQELEARQRELQRKREVLEARIQALRKEFESDEEEAQRVLAQARDRAETIAEDRHRMAISRKENRR
jgi:circadian clock protein KaiC